MFAALLTSLMAPLRHVDGSRECLFIGEYRKVQASRENDAIDPLPTFLGDPKSEQDCG
jgi:hypothetical protein